MKSFSKALANFIAGVLVVPAFLCYQLGKVVLGEERVFPGWSQWFSLIPGITGTYLRRAFYRLVLPRCGANAVLGFGTVLSHPRVEIGANVYVGHFCCLGEVTLEDDVLLSSHVSIPSGGSQHGIERLDVPIREQTGVWKRTTVGRDSWIGERAVVLADVGKHCVIGAGSVVAKPIPDFAIAFGAPAQIVRFRNDQEIALKKNLGETHLETSLKDRE